MIEKYSVDITLSYQETFHTQLFMVNHFFFSFELGFFQKELVQLFSEVGNVQDAHLQAGKSRGFTFGSVLKPHFG